MCRKLLEKYIGTLEKYIGTLEKYVGRFFNKIHLFLSIQFSGGERFQRGRGIGGLLKLAKGLFKPVIENIGKAMRSNTGQVIGNVLKDQAINTAKT